MFGGSAELGAAYEECEAAVRGFVPRLWALIGTLLPVEVLLFVQAIADWAVRTDSFGDLRHYLRGCSGATAELWAALVEPQGRALLDEAVRFRSPAWWGRRTNRSSTPSCSARSCTTTTSLCCGPRC
ncbi:hypothetical protein JG491_02445 [Streptomyces sp. CRPSP2-6A1]|uniref:hypothetical protein n=1 Tax=Streptomyces sp. CRPSP2-6A1 TaxID=2799588 RepID=UPI0018F0BA66|nr:hypothetical protein [Streptomyces sp. CRPSP2-6A1]MBJ6998944.1 hypothetical protein [Streptomyces sp. CRPSP2-6A1]